MKLYTAWRITGEKAKWVILDKTGKITNSNPSKKDLKGIERFPEKSGKNNPRLKITKEKILEYIRQFEKEYGRVPTAADFDNNPKYPCSGTVRNYFGENWNNIIMEAGLQINCFTKITDEELLGALLSIYEENGESPTERNLINNPKYPSIRPYISRFGSFEKAKKLVSLDLDSTIKKGIIETTDQKGRLAEIHVLKYDEKESIDLSGENHLSFADGISKSGVYDVKSSKLHKEKYWEFPLDKVIDFYYLLAYDNEHNILLHKWKITGDFIDKNSIRIGIDNRYIYNLKNMKEYEIIIQQ